MSLSPPAAKPKRIGNYKAGPGRPLGRKNNATLRLEEAARQAAQAIGQTLPGAFEGDAHASLTAVYKHPNIPMELRIMAATSHLRNSGRKVPRLRAPYAWRSSRRWDRHR